MTADFDCSETALSVGRSDSALCGIRPPVGVADGARVWAGDAPLARAADAAQWAESVLASLDVDVDRNAHPRHMRTLDEIVADSAPGRDALDHCADTDHDDACAHAAHADWLADERAERDLPY